MTELIYSKESKQRLDIFLTEKLPSFSRSQIQKMIKNHQVKVNGKIESAHFLLKAGDEISLILAKKTPATKKILAEPKIILQNDDYLIIDKPAGLIVHPVGLASDLNKSKQELDSKKAIKVNTNFSQSNGIHPAQGINEPTLVDWLLKKFPAVKNIGENPLRPGIVHRLDKEVSGLMVIALSQEMFWQLKKQFQNHQIKKNYLALVYGKIPSDEGVIDFPLDRSDDTGKIVAKPKGEIGKEALTKFLVLKRFSRYTYVEIEILTGRTHQIRVHLQAFGYPVVGDRLYFNKKIKDNLKLNRLFLHSHQLGFYDLANAWQKFESKLPTDLNKILTQLK